MSNVTEDNQKKKTLKLKINSVLQWIRNAFNRLARRFKKSKVVQEEEEEVVVETKEEKKMMKLKLQAVDGEVIEVDREVALKSNLIKELLKNRSQNDEELEEPVEIGQFDGKTLKKILEYCEKHRNEEYKPKGEFEDPRIQLTDSDMDYMDMPSDEIVQLLLAANYLDIPGIVDLITERIVSMAEGKSIEELEEMVALEDDFTPEDEEEIRKRFAWVEI